MKYISVDTETLGLDHTNTHLVDVSFVCADTNKEFELTTTNHLRVVFCKNILIGDIFAVCMHTELLQEINEVIQEHFKVDKKSKLEDVTWSHRKIGTNKLGRPENVLYLNHYNIFPDIVDQREGILKSALNEFFLNNGIDLQKDKINVAGKNYAKFDEKFLTQSPLIVDYIFPKIRHRVLDVGNMYVRPEDETLPDLKTCLERAGFEKSVEHNSTPDAVDVIYCVQKHFDNMAFEKNMAEQLTSNSNLDPEGKDYMPEEEFPVPAEG